MNDIEQLRSELRAVKHVLKDHIRELALLREFLRTRRPIDFRDFETWSEKQSAIWDAHEKGMVERMDAAEREILNGIRGEREQQ